jgi:hypothetical protein
VDNGEGPGAKCAAATPSAATTAGTATMIVYSHVAIEMKMILNIGVHKLA